MTFRLIALIVPMAWLASAQGPLRFELKRIEKRTTECLTTFVYPEIISAASPQARDRINAGILRLLLRRTGWPGSDSGFRSLDAYADDFLKSCKESQGTPEARPLYEHKRVTIFRYTPPILSFRCDADEDSGGVHPFGSSFFVNFETSTGKTVTLVDLLKDGALPKVQAIAEETFRRDHKLSPGENLEDQGYTFPGGRFRLNDNFGVGEDELLFLFNTYEIAAGAMGPTEIRLPYALVHSLLRPDLRLLWGGWW
jgi:hypothetical protein